MAVRRRAQTAGESARSAQKRVRGARGKPAEAFPRGGLRAELEPMWRAESLWRVRAGLEPPAVRIRKGLDGFGAVGRLGIPRGAAILVDAYSHEGSSKVSGYGIRVERASGASAGSMQLEQGAGSMRLVHGSRQGLAA